MGEKYYVDVVSALARQTINRLVIVIILLIILLCGTNAFWFVREQQYEVVETTTQEVTQTAEDGGTNRFIGGDYYGNDTDG